MSLVGKRLRMARIFADTGKSVIIALDHGIRFGVLPGLEDPIATTRRVVEGGADAVMATPAVLRLIHREVAGKAGVVCRIDGTVTVAGPDVTDDHQIASVEEATKLGADCVVAFCYIGVNRESEQLRKLGWIAEECEEYGMPLMAEMIPPEVVEYHFKSRAGGEWPVKAESLTLAARVGAELGADVIKTYYTGSRETFKRVVEGCPAPILILGGPTAGTLDDLFRMVREAMDAGAKGIVMGRKVWGSRDPAETVRALRRIVHEKMTVEEAVKGLTL